MSDRIVELFILFKQIAPNANFYSIRKSLLDFNIKIDKRALLKRLRNFKKDNND